MSTVARSFHTAELDDRIRRQFPQWRDLRLSGGIPAVTTFPGEALRTRAMIALNPDFSQEYTTWNWVDITRTDEGASIVRWEQQISIIYGGRPNSALVDASTCKFRATNDKRFSRRNPLSPYFNQLSEYTPVWIQLDYGQGWKDRYFGFIHDFSKAWDRSGNDSYIDLTGRGSLHRIGKSKPLRSPIYRAISGVAAGDYKPHGFWSGEDAADATQIASALPNQPAVIPSGEVSYGVTGPAGAASVLTAGEGFTTSFPVVSYTDTDRWAVTWIMKIDAQPAANTTIMTAHSVGGTLVTWVLTYEFFAGLDFYYWRGYDSTGATIYSMSFTLDTAFGGLLDPPDFYGHWFMWTVGAYNRNVNQVGSTLTLDNGTDVRHASVNGNILVGRVGAITDFGHSIDTNLATAGLSMGQFAVFVDVNFSPFNTAAALANGEALNGYDQEPAITRMRRLAREENIPFFSQAIEEDSALCGPQEIGSLVNNFRIPELVDSGTLYEYKFGLAYKSPYEYQNQSVGLTLDAALSQILDLGSPVDNDLDFVNQWTIQRSNGSSVTVQGRKGESSVELADTELVYESSKTVPLANDSQLLDYASRLVAQTTVDEDRWPTIAFTLAAHPELIGAWIDFAFGGRINALNVFEEVGVTTLDQIHKGHQEAWNSRQWDVVLNVGPASVFNVTELDSGILGRIDSDSSTLALDIADNDFDFMVATSDENEEWINLSDNPDEFPLDIRLYPGIGDAISSGGEVITIDQITTAITDTFARVGADWGITSTGETWSILSGTPAVFTTTGSAGRIALATINVEHFAVVDLGYAAQQRARVSNLLNVTPTGAAINWGVILRCSNQNNLYWIDVQVGTTGSLTLRLISKKQGANVVLTSVVSATVHSTVIERILVAEVTSTNVIRAKVYANGSPEPDWEVSFQDTSGDLLIGTMVGCIARLTTGNTNATPVNVDFSNFTVRNPQRFVVDARAVNGISKAHKAGTRVRVANMTVIG